MRFGIIPEGTLKVDNTPSLNTGNTYEHTSLSIVSDVKLALNAFFSTSIGNGELSIVRNGLTFQSPLGNT